MGGVVLEGREGQSTEAGYDASCRADVPIGSEGACRPRILGTLSSECLLRFRRLEACVDVGRLSLLSGLIEHDWAGLAL